MNCLIERNKICQKRIVFISDLHFDFVKDTSRESGHRFAPELSKGNQSDFINYIIENHANDILCLGGDFYNDFKPTLAFLQEMEAKQILGFFVLGNHDYWNDGTLSHENIIDIFDSTTANNKHFRFLTTGKKYFIDDLCFIGDTGWTSFKRTLDRFTSKERVKEIKSFKQFMGLPDARATRDFDPKKIRNFHNLWVDFANSVLTQEQKVVILTHYPMIDLTKQEDIDCWWSSVTQLLNTENQWRLFGHTHSKQYSSGPNITRQRGYDNKIMGQDISALYEEVKEQIRHEKQRQLDWCLEKNYPYRVVKNENGEKEIQNYIVISEEEIQARLEKLLTQYLPSDFGILHKTSDRCELSVPFQNILAKFYTTALVADPNESSQLSNSVKRSGYRRPAANKVNFAHLAHNKAEYLKRVRNEISMAANSGNVRIGYYYKLNFKQETIEALNAAADYLEHNDIRNDVRAFITAAVITGYAWNRELYWLESMRPINDYDVARFFLQFLTMQKYNITFDKIHTIERSRKDKIAFGNIELWLPMVNGKQLTIEQVMIAFSPTPLIGHINPDGIKYKVICQSCGHEWERNKKDKIHRCIYCAPKQIPVSKEKELPVPKPKLGQEYYLKRFQDKLSNINSNIQAISYRIEKYGYAKLQCSACNYTWEQRSDHFFSRPNCPKCKK